MRFLPHYRWVCVVLFAPLPSSLRAGVLGRSVVFSNVLILGTSGLCGSFSSAPFSGYAYSWFVTFNNVFLYFVCFTSVELTW